MGHVDDLNRLENIVEKLLASLDAIQKERNELSGRLSQLENEKKKLQQELQNQQEDKEQIRQRVNSLISGIEKWEKSFALFGTGKAEARSVSPGVAGQSAIADGA